MFDIICGTGHRPQKLDGFGHKAQHMLVNLAEDWLADNKPDRVISGGALGWDTALALAALKCGIYLTVAVPFVGQESKWPSESQEIYRGILERANYVHVVVVSDGNDSYSYPSETEIEKSCKYVADQEADRFYIKMIDKLGGFVLSLGKELVSVEDVTPEHTKTPRRSEIKFEFKDKSGFTLISSIVNNMSPLKNPFYQYPTVFRNAYTPNGPISSPSEFNVKKAFNG